MVGQQRGLGLGRCNISNSGTAVTALTSQRLLSLSGFEALNPRKTVTILIREAAFVIASRVLASVSQLMSPFVEPYYSTIQSEPHHKTLL